tara:strand:- start:110 stop:379 length:270 start_codon:yes stop_codon:yes gene_type:complete
MLDNLTTILNKMEIKDDDDFKKTVNNAIKNAMNNKTKTTKIKAAKEPKELTAYQLFVKEKMPEVKDKFPPKERMGAISQLWKEKKEESE